MLGLLLVLGDYLYYEAYRPEWLLNVNVIGVIIVVIIFLLWAWASDFTESMFPTIPSVSQVVPVIDQTLLDDCYYDLNALYSDIYSTTTPHSPERSNAIKKAKETNLYWESKIGEREVRKVIIRINDSYRV